MPSSTVRPTVSTAATWSRLALVLALLAAVLLGAAPMPADAASMKSPSGLKAIAKTTTTLTFTWKSVAKAENYRLQYSTSSKMKKAEVPARRRHHRHPHRADEGTTYYVKVRVIDADGENLSSYSKAVKVKTPSKDPVSTGGPRQPHARRRAPPPTPTEPDRPADPLRVASYNIKCANCNSHLPNEGTWEERRQAVVDTILGQHLDVVGLQEAGQAWLKDANGKSLSPSLTQFEDLRNRLGGSWTLTNPNRNNCVKSTTPSSCVYKDQGASQDTKIIFDSLADRAARPGVQEAARSSTLTTTPATSPGPSSGSVRPATGSCSPRRTWSRPRTRPGRRRSTTCGRTQTEVSIDAVTEHNPDHLPVIFDGDFNSSRFAHDYSPTNAPYDVLVRAGLVDPLGAACRTTKTAPGATVVKRINTWVDSFNDFDRVVNNHKTGWINGSYIDYMFVSPSDQGARVGDGGEHGRERPVRRHHPLRPQHDPGLRWSCRRPREPRQTLSGSRPRSGSRPMKPSRRVWASASSGTGTAGPYCPDDRNSSSMGTIPASRSAHVWGSRRSS